MNFEIILSDTNEEVCTAFRHLFRHRLVSVEEGDLFEVAADAYVSPGNSHGIMDGGLDRLLRARFPGVEAKVQAAIDEQGGLLPVGQAVIVETDDSDVPYLVCAPTMVVPSSLTGLCRNGFSELADSWEGSHFVARRRFFRYLWALGACLGPQMVVRFIF